MGESANEICPVKMCSFCHVSMFWTLVDLLCTKRLFSQETAFFPRFFYQIQKRKEFVLQRIQLFLRLVLFFAGYSIIWQGTSRYRTTIDSYLLRIEKKSVIFSGSNQVPQRNTMLSQENM